MTSDPLIADLLRLALLLALPLAAWWFDRRAGK